MIDKICRTEEAPSNLGVKQEDWFAWGESQRELYQLDSEYFEKENSSGTKCSETSGPTEDHKHNVNPFTRFRKLF